MRPGGEEGARGTRADERPRKLRVTAGTKERERGAKARSCSILLVPRRSWLSCALRECQPRSVTAVSQHERDELVSLGIGWAEDDYIAFDDNSCRPPPVLYGCTDPAAANYRPLANEDDGGSMCKYRGCLHPLALNYNPSATVKCLAARVPALRAPLEMGAVRRSGRHSPWLPDLGGCCRRDGRRARLAGGGRPALRLATSRCAASGFYPGSDRSRLRG